MNLDFIGLSLSSSWGNGHATTYRALLKALACRGHRIRFFEYDAPWYREHRDLPDPEYAELVLYRDIEDAKEKIGKALPQADAVTLGSYTHSGVELGRWLADEIGGSVPYLFYDIDTPVTLRKLGEGDFEYVDPELVAQFSAYLSFSGGRALHELETRYHVRAARAFHCSADPDLYYPVDQAKTCALGYLGTYSKDRHPPMERLLIETARQLPRERFEVIGPQYPSDFDWPPNVCRQEHLPPSQHRNFYNYQRYTLNITRADMVQLGHSPSVRLFEAAACGVPIISDCWIGIGDYFTPGEEILLARDTDDVIRILEDVGEEESRAIGQRARARFLAEHAPERRAEQFEAIVFEARGNAEAPHGAAGSGGMTASNTD